MGTSMERAAERLSEARSILFVTGAGLSADSGLPTYRGVGGLYQREDPAAGVPIELALSASMLRRDPALCWKYLREIGLAIRGTCGALGARPNAGHRAIAAFERARERVWVLTQNVDGLHQAAGSRQVIAIHGDAGELLCTRCSYRTATPAYAELALPPACPDCGALVRPDVVLFDEQLPAQALATLERELALGFDAVVSVGTSSLFPYIVEPVLAAKRAGGATIEINPSPTILSELVDVRLELGAADALSALRHACLGDEPVQ